MIGNQFLKNDDAFSVFDLCCHTPLIFHWKYVSNLSCEEFILKNRFYPKCKVKEKKKREGG